jgi:septum formation protein
VLGADTLVALEGEPIGKPRNLKEAAKILRRLSGREHEVCTAVCVVAGRRMMNFQLTSRVRFHSLTSEQIDAYLEKIDPLDKAGAYAAQGHGGEIIRGIRGSYTNVVGLPMGETLRALATFGLRPAARRG